MNIHTSYKYKYIHTSIQHLDGQISGKLPAWPFSYACIHLFRLSWIHDSNDSWLYNLISLVNGLKQKQLQNCRGTTDMLGDICQSHALCKVAPFFRQKNTAGFLWKLGIPQSRQFNYWYYYICTYMMISRWIMGYLIFKQTQQTRRTGATPCNSCNSYPLVN